MNLSEFLQIKTEEAGASLALHPGSVNHVGTMHASAQFCLAEIASGQHLGQLFPDYRDRVLAVLRRAEVKFSKPGDSRLTAVPSLSPDSLDRVHHDLATRGWAVAELTVDLLTAAQVRCFSGTFQWFVKVI